MNVARQFKVGDHVRIIKSVPSYNNGWNNSWETVMNKAIGKTGTIVQDRGKRGYEIEISGMDTFDYPVEVLEYEIPNDLQVGQRVLTQNGYKGIVTGFDGRFIRVKYKNLYNTEIEGVWFPENVFALGKEQTPSITPVATIAPATSAVVSQTVFNLAKQIAVELGKAKRHVDASMVQAELEKRGYNSSQLGNAAGMIFRSGPFRHTGQYTKNERAVSRGRKIAIWEYTDIVKSEPKGFIVETQSFFDNDNWYRSCNSSEKGEKLSTLVFSTFEEADKEAKRQAVICYPRPYRAVPLP